MTTVKCVTGGDLHDLWLVANEYLPKVEGVYNRQLDEMIDITEGPDDKKFGKCHPWWVLVAQEYKRFLFETSVSLSSTSSSVNQAIDEYSYVDEATSDNLTEAGKHLKDNLDGRKPFEPTEMPSDGDYAQLDYPDSWVDEHDE